MDGNDMPQEEWNAVVGERIDGYRCAIAVTPRCYELQLVEAAHLYWRGDGRALALRGRWSWVNLPGRTCAYGPGADEPGWTHRYLVMSGRRCAVWRELGLLPAAPIEIPAREMRTLSALFDDALGLVRAGCPPSRLAAANAIERILLRLRELALASGGRPSWLDECLARLDEDVVCAPDYHRIAAHCGLSLRTVQRQFRRWTGLTPHTYHLHAKIARAKILLAAGAAPLAEIAEALGFCDAYHLGRTFRRVTGMAPGAYRRTLPPRR